MGRLSMEERKHIEALERRLRIVKAFVGFAPDTMTEKTEALILCIAKSHPALNPGDRAPLDELIPARKKFWNRVGGIPEKSRGYPSWEHNLGTPDRSALGKQCRFCGGEDCVDHHIIPRRCGGIDHELNRVYLCGDCHPVLEAHYGRICRRCELDDEGGCGVWGMWRALIGVADGTVTL